MPRRFTNWEVAARLTTHTYNSNAQSEFMRRADTVPPWQKLAERDRAFVMMPRALPRETHHSFSSFAVRVAQPQDRPPCCPLLAMNTIR
jgi:hypothetical protein